MLKVFQYLKKIDDCNTIIRDMKTHKFVLLHNNVPMLTNIIDWWKPDNEPDTLYIFEPISFYKFSLADFSTTLICDTGDFNGRDTKELIEYFDLQACSVSSVADITIGGEDSSYQFIRDPYRHTWSLVIRYADNRERASMRQIDDCYSFCINDNWYAFMYLGSTISVVSLNKYLVTKMISFNLTDLPLMDVTLKLFIDDGVYLFSDTAPVEKIQDGDVDVPEKVDRKVILLSNAKDRYNIYNTERLLRGVSVPGYCC